eukprot:3778619-Pyramimonas_sp.AAC.1
MSRQKSLEVLKTIDIGEEIGEELMAMAEEAEPEVALKLAGTMATKKVAGMMVGTMVWMLGAMLWMVGATLWMTGAMVWMVGAMVWMLGAM